MRDSFGTLVLEAEAPMDTDSQAMRHSEIGITKKIYAPDVGGLNERALSAFENYVAPEIVSELKSSAAEITTQEPLEIVMPIEISKRAHRAQIDYQAMQKSSK
jgi:hypothetical protein